MKPWQVIALIALTVFGVGFVVYLATRRDSPSDDDDDPNGMMAGGSAADMVEGWGNVLTGAAAGVTRLATSSSS